MPFGLRKVTTDALDDFDLAGELVVPPVAEGGFSSMSSVISPGSCCSSEEEPKKEVGVAVYKAT